MEQAKDISETSPAETNGSFKVPPDLRKAKVAQVMGLLEREYVSCFARSPVLLEVTDRSQIRTRRSGAVQAGEAELVYCIMKRVEIGFRDASILGRNK